MIPLFGAKETPPTPNRENQDNQKKEENNAPLLNIQPAAQPTPAPAEPTPPVPREDKNANVYTVFKTPTTDSAPDMLDNIINNDAETTTAAASVLGKKPMGEYEAFKPAQTQQVKNMLTIAKLALGLVIGLSIIAHSYFYMQNNTETSLIGSSSADNLVESQQQLVAAYNNFITRSLLIAAIDIDHLTIMDENYTQASESKRKVILSQYQDLLSSLQRKLRFKDFPPQIEDQYENFLEAKLAYSDPMTSSIDSEISVIEAATNNDEEADHRLKLLKSSKTLYTKAAIRKKLSGIKTDENTLAEDLMPKVRSITQEINTTPATLISNIKASQIDWESIIKRITVITQSIDPNHAHDRFKHLRNISYSSFTLNDDNIIISGAITSKDSKNFSKIADLLDALEKAEEFTNVETRAFAKNFNEETGTYESSLQIKLQLTSDEEEVIIEDEDAGEPETIITE